MVDGFGTAVLSSHKPVNQARDQRSGTKMVSRLWIEHNLFGDGEIYQW